MLALRTPGGRTVYASKSWPLAGSTGTAPRIFNQLPSRLDLIGSSATYSQLYWSQPWVYSVINKIVRGVSRLDLKTYEFDESRTPKEDPTAVPAKVLRAPYPRAGAFQLKEFIMGSLCVYGNATLVKFRGGSGRTPQELWPMPFQNVTIIEGREQPIAAYQYQATLGGKPITFLPEDVLHFSWFNPDGKPWGRSPLEALAATLALEDAGQRYSLSYLGNNARPASFIVSENKLTKEQRDTLKVEIESAYGGPDNAGKVALLDNGLDWKPIGQTARESSLIETRKLSREEVCTVYDMPPPLVGILENATYSNIDTQHIMLYMDTFAPLCHMLEDTMNAQFIMAEPAWDGYFCRFDMDAVLRGNLEQRSQSYQRQFMSGGLTPNEQRILEGRAPIGDQNDPNNPANQIYVPVNTAPVTPDGVKPIQAPVVGRRASDAPVPPNGDKPTQIPAETVS